MTIIYYFAALAVLLLLVYFFQQQIIKYSCAISLLIFGNNRVGVYFYFLFFLPGVILHELSHLFTASILGVPSGELTLFPRKQAGDDNKQDWVLGQVKSAETDPIRSSLIGLAPMIVGITIIMIISKLIQHDGIWQTILWLYLILVFANTMFLSQDDRVAIWVLPIFLFLLGVLAWLLTDSRIFTVLENLLLLIFQPLIISFGLTVVVDLIFLIPLIFITQMLLRLRG